VDLIKIKLDDDKFVARHSLGKIVKKAEETLILMGKRGILKKKFGNHSNYILKYGINCIVQSFTLILVLIDRDGMTSTAIRIGHRILFSLYKEDSCGFSTYKEYKKGFEYNSNTSILTLGMFFIEMLATEPTAVFEKNYEYSEDGDEYFEPVTLKINSEYLDVIKENLLIHPSSLPMVCAPNK
jgi:hypothetical protein